MLENIKTVLIENIRVSLDGGDGEAKERALKIFRASRLYAAVTDTKIHRKSVDARKKESICFMYSVALTVKTKLTDNDITASGFKLYNEAELELNKGAQQMNGRPVIVGFGPAGIFNALVLAEQGYKPLILERGGDIKSRIASVNAFYNDGLLDENCNIQFGAGGAGTFSDGKLTTRIGDARCSYVLRRFCEFGAPEEIRYKAKPHIGTDNLRKIISNAQKYLLSLGAEIRYNTTVTEIGDDCVTTADGEQIPFGALILATGHSARGIYKNLLDGGYDITPKPYSVGVRIEHRAADIDAAMYGATAGNPALGHADYNLSTHEGGRGVYTFCMCPGGEVVAAASEAESVVVNGMSNFKRNGANSNAAIAVTVTPDDYGGNPYDAIDFRVHLEKAAYAAAASKHEYNAPMQTVGDFLNGGTGTFSRRITPSYMGGGRVTPVDLHAIFPSFVTDALAVGLREFGRKLRGFDSPDAPMTGVESRTSAPVRINRNDNFTAIGHDNIYPCGEGAGYAGGIISSAVDGIAVATAIIARYKPE